MKKRTLALILALILALSVAIPGTLAVSLDDDSSVATFSLDGEAGDETPVADEVPVETEATPEPTAEPEAPAEEPTATPEATEAPAEEPTASPEATSEPTETPVPSETPAPAEPQVGDTIWIRSGALTYKAADTASGSRDVVLNYETRIVSITTDENGDVWYEFKPTGLLAVFPEYRYVLAVNTTTEQPEPTAAPEPSAGAQDENACTCGEDAPENLAEHPDSCPRKQYVLGLIQTDDGAYKSAAEIYADWETYEDTTRSDILNLVEKVLPTEYDALLSLIEAEETPGEEEISFVDYSGTTSSGVNTVISAPEGAFPEGTTLTVTDTEVTAAQLAGLFSDILGIVAVDITFGCQPDGRVVVTLNIPAGSVPTGANMVYIVHIGENGAEIITYQYLNTASEGQSITFGADSFSSYAAVFVSSKYASQKLSTVLANDDRYSIHTFDVQLFDYDPGTMNTQLRGLGESSFLFRGFGATGDTGTSGVNDSSAAYAKQGIVAGALTDGLPVFNYVSNGTDTGKYLFDTNTTVSGKEVYADTKFQFVYDSETGYYQYKSSANHAQFNNTTKTIELYADTLSTKNQYLATLDLSTATGINGYSSITKSKDSFKATAIATTNSNNVTRFDPYVHFAVPNEGTGSDKLGQAAENINKIYVKAKIPAVVGSNRLQVFFNSGSGMNETESFVVEYTATGEWIEFVIDTSTCGAWSKDKRITQLRIDLFDSNKGTALTDTAKTYEVEIAQISLIQSYDDYVTRGGFYPFSDIADSYPGNGSNFSYDDWVGVMRDEGKVNVLSSRSINNPDANATELKKDLYFGVVMEFDFYIPVDKTVNNEDLIYYFNGDDDLWVFIDGQLALDIGGGHGGITGTINLTKGVSTVNNAVTVTGYDSNGGTPGAKTTNLNESLTSPGKHTMKIFYMERCGSVSNCFMKFNLPQTPQGAATVSKSVVDDFGQQISALSDQTYTFIISGTFATDEGNALDVSNLTYKLFDELTGKTETKTVGQGGTFSLTATQQAVFDIDENYYVTVAENKPLQGAVKGYGYVSTTVNGTSGLSGVALTSKDGAIEFDFVNKYEPLYGNIKIEKCGISELDHDQTTENQSSVFHVDGTSTTGVKLSMDVVIVGNGSKLIEHVPVGNYTVTELTDWTWRYGTQNEIKVAVTGNSTAQEPATVIFSNSRTNQYWLSGDNYIRNWWGSIQEEKTGTQ